MKEYKHLAEADRNLRRTAMDAVEVLRNEVGFQDDDQAEFQIGLMRLASGNLVGLVEIHFDDLTGKVVYRVSLPTSTHFHAIPHGFPVRRRFEIARLSHAKIDGYGLIWLNDGSELRALEIEPAHLPLEPSGLDWRIVHLTLECVNARDCYRGAQEGVPPDLRDMVPDLHFLDFARLSDLVLPPLKDIADYIAKKHRKVSGQQIANSLRKFGIRHPQDRPT